MFPGMIARSSSRSCGTYTKSRIVFQPKLNGNVLAVREQRLHIVLENKPQQEDFLASAGKTTWESLPGMLGTQIRKLIQSCKRNRTHFVCMTCTATSWNGARTGTFKIYKMTYLIRKGRMRDRAVCYVVVLGV